MQPQPGNHSPEIANPKSQIRNRKSLFPILILIITGIILTSPLLNGETLCTDDGALHVYRTVALDRAIKDGELYPRWFPDLAYGYGFPFFVYREPLGYYALEALHLIGVSIPTAFNLVLAASLILSGIGMYLLGRDIFSSRGGLLAGALYMAAPYTLIGPLRRGNLPEVIAFALMPLLLFSMRRLVLTRHTRYFVATIVVHVALILTHNISNLLFTPVLLVYLCILGWVYKRDERLAWIRTIAPALLAILLALGLTAFFWYPALAEQDQVQLYLTHSARGNDYHFNFISLGELLGGPGASDPQLLNPPLRIIFGWPQVALATLGIFALRRRSIPSHLHTPTHLHEQRATIIAAAMATAALSFMALPVSLPLWDNLPLIRFVQFPWRFVGRALLPATLLAAAIVQDTLLNAEANSPLLRLRPTPLRMRLEDIGLAALIFATLLFAAPQLYPNVCPTPHDLDINDVFAYEHGTQHIGVDPLGAYLPRAVIERPIGSPLEAQYAAGETITRFDTTTLPDGAQLMDAHYAPNRADIVLSTPVAFRARYLAFDFPGWSIAIDDQPVSTTLTDPNGLITFDAPRGEHHIHIAFGPSQQRALAETISMLALIPTFASALTLKRRSRASQPDTLLSTQPISNLQSPVSNFQSLISSLALVLFILIKILLIDAQQTPLRTTRLNDNTLIGVSHPLDITFGDQIRLLGYDIGSETARPGDEVRIDLYWRALRPLDRAYQADAGIVDQNGWPWSPKGAPRPRDFKPYPPTSGWPVDAYAIDSFDIEVLPGASPGDYMLFTQLFDRETLEPLQPDIPSLQGRIAATLGPIHIDRATRSFNAAQLRIYGGERIELGDDLTLLGYNIDRIDVVPGESVLLTFFWQAKRDIASDRSHRIELLDPTDRVIASQDMLIGQGDYFTSHWRVGEQIITLAHIRVPALAGSGAHRWRAALLDASGQPQHTFNMLPTLNVAAPQHVFDAPQLQNRVEETFGGVAELLGFALESDRLAPGDAVDLTLFWRARSETTSNYKVFVHILNGDQIIAQADAVPANNARPTTGWTRDEVIEDVYRIALPDDAPRGTHSIAVGLYDALTRLRLHTADGRETILLTTLHVE
jgi:hypothetical protein